MNSTVSSTYVQISMHFSRKASKIIQPFRKILFIYSSMKNKKMLSCPSIFFCISTTAVKKITVNKALRKCVVYR